MNENLKYVFLYRDYGEGLNGLVWIGLDWFMEDRGWMLGFVVEMR